MCVLTPDKLGFNVTHTQPGKRAWYIFIFLDKIYIVVLKVTDLWHNIKFLVPGLFLIAFLPFLDSYQSIPSGRIGFWLEF